MKEDWQEIGQQFNDAISRIKVSRSSVDNSNHHCLNYHLFRFKRASKCSYYIYKAASFRLLAKSVVKLIPFPQHCQPLWADLVKKSCLFQVRMKEREREKGHNAHVL